MVSKNNTKKGFKVGKKASKGNSMGPLGGTPGKSKIPRQISSGGNNKMAYAKLLFDPCSADLVEPPYIGIESGYMVRTRDVVIPYVVGPGLLAGNYDFALQWSPGNLALTSSALNYGLLCGGGASASGVTLVPGTKQYNAATGLPVAQQNFINNTATPVNSYRVVACCVSFIPTGPPLSRQGVVSAVTVPNAWATVVGLYSGLSTNIEEACPHVRTNGAESHEIIWLPSAKDQEYGTFTPSVVDSGYGSILFALANIDSSMATSGANNVITPNGRFEITTVWQWTPKINGGLIQTARSPPKHTVNDVLSEIKNIGEKVYTGAKHIATGAVAVEKLLARIL